MGVFSLWLLIGQPQLHTKWFIYWQVTLCAISLHLFQWTSTFLLVLHWWYSWEIMWCLMYILCKISKLLWLFVWNIFLFFCIFSVFQRILYLRMCSMWENSKSLKASWISCINLWWLNTFTNCTFSKNHTLRKVDVLPFLTVSSSWAFQLSVNLRSGKGLLNS